MNIRIRVSLAEKNNDPSITKKPKSTVTEPTHNAVRVEGLISCDAIAGSSKQISLEFIIESFVHAYH